MSALRETETIERSSPTDDSVHRLLSFYKANGYRVVECRDSTGEAVEAPHDDQVEVCDTVRQATVERGKPGAGWWTSDMTKLHTVVVLENLGDCVKVTYEVETSGQWLNEVEQAFWRRELKWARRWVCKEGDQPHDLREEESRRAKNQTRGMRSTGLWGAMIVFIVIVALGFLGII